MVWVKLTDDYPDSAKIKYLSDGAFRLNTTAICWSNRFGTDGFVPEVWVAGIRPKGDGPRLVQELLDPPIGQPGSEPVWHLSTAPCTGCQRDWGYTAKPGGYWIHDHTQYQGKAATWEELREKKREAGRAGGLRAGEVRRAKEADTEQAPQQLLHIEGAGAVAPAIAAPPARATANGKQVKSKRASRPVAVPEPVPGPAGDVPRTDQDLSEGARAPLKADPVVRAYVEGLKAGGHPRCDAEGKRILGQHARTAIDSFFSDARLIGRDWYDPRREAEGWIERAVDAARNAGRAGRNPAFLVEWMERERLLQHERIKAEDRGRSREGGLRRLGGVA